MRWVLVAVALGSGCGRKPGRSAAARDAAPRVAATDATHDACERLPFAASIPVPEASGAVLMPIDGADALLVVGDSGNTGAYGILDPADGTVRELGSLPLDPASTDDLEGLAVRDGRIVGLTSLGWIMVWQRKGHGFELVDGAYPIADAASGLACGKPRAPLSVTCGKNYEGLCLRSGPVPAGECVGLAAAKADGALYCLTEDAGRLVASPRSIKVSAPETLTGCDIADDGAVWAGTNLFGRSAVYRVTGWPHPEDAVVTEIANIGDGFPESIVIAPDDVVYRFSDTGTAPSLVSKFRCPVAGR